VWLAFNIAALSRAPKLTNDTYQSLLIKQRDTRPQSLEEQHRVARMIANTFRAR
jgi:hypothetical protein